MGRGAEALSVVAQRLLAIPQGGRIPTTGQLAAEAKVGVGTVHTALTTLRDKGAVELTSHGHLGTKLVSRNLAALWDVSGLGTLVGALPFPQSLEFTGLATALTESLEEVRIPLQIVFRQGGRRRIDLLAHGRADFVVLSWMAASKLPRKALFELMTLPDFTFYRKGSVVVIRRAGDRRRRPRLVAIDRSSYDHTSLTRAEFPDARYRDAHYIRIPEMVARGEVDGAVWHQTSSSPLLIAVELEICPLSRPSPAGSPEMCRAAFVWRTGEAATRAVLLELVDVDRLRAIQQQVIEGRRLPSF